MEGDQISISPRYSQDYLDEINDAMKFRKNLNFLRKNERYVDVLLSCQNVCFPAHRVILASRSKCFSQVFEHDDADGDTELVLIHDTDPEILEGLLEYIYTNEIKLKQYAPNKLRNVIYTGKSLELDNFITYCKKNILNCLSLCTFADALEIAAELADPNMEKTILNFIASNMTIMWTVTEFLTLPITYVVKVCEIACNQGYVQDIILKAILAWIKHDKKNREEEWSILLKVIQFQELSDQYVRYLLDDEALIHDIPEFKTRLLQVLAEKPDVSRVNWPLKSVQVTAKSAQGDFDIIERNRLDILTPFDKPQPPLLTILANDFTNSHSLFITYYSLEKNEWSNNRSIKLSINPEAGIVYSEDKLFVIGGEDARRNVKLGSCFFHDIQRNTTISLPDLRVPRSKPLVFLKEGILYVAGGEGRLANSILSHVERLEHLGRWMNLQSMCSKRDWNSSVCELRDRVIVIGTSNNLPATCEYFLTGTRSWHELTSLPVTVDPENGRWLATSINDQLYLLKSTKANSLFLFDMNIQTWKEIPTIGDVPVSITHVTHWKNKILVVNQQLNIYECDAETLVWSALSQVPKSLSVIRYFYCEI